MPELIEPTLVRERSTTIGTGAYALAGAATGYYTFASQLAEGDWCYACVRMPGNVNIEIGRYTLTSGALARTEILKSTNADAAVSWPEGTKDIVASRPGFSLLDSADLAEWLAAYWGPGKHSIWVPALAMIPRITNGAAPGLVETTTNKNMVATLDFDATTQEFAQVDVRMPKSWDEGTVSFIPVWTHGATTTNFGVVWGLDAVAIGNDDALDAAFGTEQTSTDTGGTTDDAYQGPESAALTIAGTPAEGDLVQFRIHRNPAAGSDTMAVDAKLIGVLVLYTNAAGNDS